ITADRAIFGTDAWRLLQPMLGYPLVTSLLSYAYHAWVGLIYAGAIYFSFGAQDREVRARYFITFFTIWTVVGLALATGMASVGPCFVGPLLGYHEFDQLVAYLNAANEQHRVMVLPVQQELLAGYLTDARGLGQGIAAMPSMHVGLATLFALATWRINKLAGVLFTVFAAVIAVASVHLAYHYAVDGIVAAAVTIMTWAVAGPLAKRICCRSAASVQPTHPTGEAVAA
ncbi:MAG: phosphatase PAP2 family protein, partial [Croceibacterium sp.]